MDSVIASLRKNRALIEAQLKEDEEALHKLALKEAELKDKRQKLQAVHDSRAAHATDIRERLAIANQHVAATTTAARKTTSATVYASQGRTSNYISATLAATRGYSCKPEDAPHRAGTTKLSGTFGTMGATSRTAATTSSTKR